MVEVEIDEEDAVPLLPDLQSWLDEAAVRHGIPGAAVAVCQGDALAEAATGVVNRNTEVATTPESLFQIGSVTKVWTATLVMQLVDEGLVDLDEPVRRYLPGFAVADPEATETVTVRQLLLHTGGFDGDLFEDTGRGDDALDRYLAYLRGGARQVSAPGVMYSYCNSGYSVLGALVARLRGGSWESTLRDRLIGPLDARHMAVLPEEAILFRAAAGHVKPNGSKELTVVAKWQLPRSFGPAGGSPCAAPRDLVRFGRMFLSGGTTAAGARLLSAGALAAMTSSELTLPGVPERGAVRRGLGPVLFDWDGTTVIGHDGDTMGQSTVWRVVPEHGLVVAMSANSVTSTGFLDDVLDPIVRELTGLTVPARPTPPHGPRKPGPPHYAGRYHYPLYTYDVTATDDGIDVTATAHGIAAQSGEPATTERYVALTDSTFVTLHPENGLHSTITFIDEGQYLHTGRAAARINS
jgi:CubicO group peptidase (beta-lactamase class C family)